MAYMGLVASDHHDSVNVASFAVNVLQAVPVGQVIILAVNAPAVTLMTGFTATDSKGNTYTLRGFKAHATAANGQVGLFGAIPSVALTTSDTITVTAVGASPGKWAVIAVAFDDINNGFDTTAGVGTNTTTSSALTSGSTAAASANQELVVGAFGFTDSATRTFTPGSGFTASAKVVASPSSAPKSLVVEWQYVNAAGTRSADGTLSGSEAWAAIVGAWKQSFPAPTAAVWNWKDAGGTYHPAQLVPL